MQRSSLCGLLLLSGIGCAHGPTAETTLAELREHLTDTQRKEAEGRRKIEELENRLFLLTDQLESQKVAAVSSRAPRLPVVTLRPSAESADDSGDRAPSNEDIEFTGAAKSIDAARVRPVLRGDGMSGSSTMNTDSAVAEGRSSRKRAHTIGSSDGGGSANMAAAEVRLASTSGGGELGVAPVPTIPQILKNAPAPKAVAITQQPALDQEPLAMYRTAYAEVTATHYDDAIAKLRAFLRRYPHHDYADNAQYWIGECFYARQRYREAAVEFRATVAQYPVGNKAPDALLKLAYSLLGLGEEREARRMLEELPQTYPRSEASRLATQKIVELSGSAKKTVEAPR